MSTAGERHITQSADGSTTLWVPGLDEHYHSIHGALTESQHVFIEAGLKAIGTSTIRILEVGLGTALNARLTFEQAQQDGITITYDALEKFPLTKEEIEAIGLQGMGKEAPFLSATPGASTQLTEQFTFRLLVEDLKTFDGEQGAYDLIYFDAFAPSAQPDLWTDAVFENMYGLLKPGGALVTYCAKGAVKRSMKAAGFEVEALPGPPRKREMTRAWKR
ncbi:MAG: tRNA (5-methylaminomethyl-2-thiouridine)(34)-methyltransferase MnmD [Schleiferiaceae bacterium]|jgi:tRNA U34 5-methylaminomethyl-2-thiouridine-forming methyltransferase MnmC